MKEHKTKQRVMVVDDTPYNIDLMRAILADTYEIIVATNGLEAIGLAHSENLPDIILLDIMMPEMDGYEVCTLLKSSKRTKHIPVIFITAKDYDEDQAKGFSIGAVDYITKPISLPIVKARVATHLALSNQNRLLEEKVYQRTKELNATQDITIRSLAILAEYRDNETGGHIVRTQHYVRILAEKLKKHSRFSYAIGSDESIELLFKSVPLHDIGKVAIKDDILLKSGRLTDEEFAEIKRHAIYGAQALEKAQSSISEGLSSSFLTTAKEVALTHHEKYDGQGYPYGLIGDEIPISGRLMAIADIYDALVTKRVYKPPFSHKKAYSIITEGDGRVEPCHFDPDVLVAFKESAESFRELAIKFADSEEERQAIMSNNN
ncbi:MAG: response regulator [Desulfamplus sp.]|nr:response regulator [Desulfamplus sp.]